MKIDRFTKVVLTVIAINLTILTLSKIELIRPAKANSSDYDISNSFSNYAMVPLNDDGSINVKLMGSEKIDVNIADISTYDKLKVELDNEVDVSIRSIRTNDKLGVNIKEISTTDEMDVNIDEVGGIYTGTALDVNVR